MTRAAPAPTIDHVVAKAAVPCCSSCGKTKYEVQVLAALLVEVLIPSLAIFAAPGGFPPRAFRDAPQPEGHEERAS